MMIKDARLLQMVKNEQWELIIAELTVKIINGEYLNFGERMILKEANNRLNPEFKIN